MRPRLRILLAASAAALWSGLGRADVDVTNSIVFRAGPQGRYGTVPPTTEAVAPIYEMLTLAAHDVANPVAERLELVVSGWGGANVGSNPWWNGYLDGGAASGDLSLAYVKGEFGRGAVVARLGRMIAAGGGSRMLHLDGASVLLRLPAGFALSAFGGSPVSARFDFRGGPYDANPVSGDLAAGGRLSWTHRLVELGAWSTLAWDHGDVSRQDVGGDLRLSPLGWLDLMGYGGYALDRSQLSEISATAVARASTSVQVSADYRYTVPSLFLSQQSILWVFSDESREDASLNVRWNAGRGFTVDAGGAYLVAEKGGRASARATYRPDRRGAVGLEGSWADTFDNSYVLGRLFGSRQIGPVAASVDLQAMRFDTAVNGETSSLLGSASVGYPIAAGLTATLAGTASATPWYKNRFDVLAKLVYQNFPAREVRP